MSNNSDYKKNRTRIDELLPTPYQSNVNRSILENTINRMLSPKETTYIDGYVGENNSQAINSRQIVESSIIRQANQLQPILTSILGSERKYMSWEDVINELELQGIDMDEFPRWGKSEKYNWVPPIDLDKLIHYQDYFWVNANANSQLEYITIKSACNTTMAKAAGLEAVSVRFGAEFNIDANVISETSNSFNISTINSTTNIIRVSTDITNTVAIGEYLQISGTVSNNVSVKVLDLAVGTNNINTWTDITVSANTLNVNQSTGSDETIGQVTKNTFNGFTVQENLTDLFENGFTFFIKDSTNNQLDNRFFNVISSSVEDNVTSIIVDKPFTNSSISGTISLSEQVTLAHAVTACQCTGTITQDVGIWSEEFLTSLDGIIRPLDPTSTNGVDGDFWYSIESGDLFQRINQVWELVFGNFNTVLVSVSGISVTDFQTICTTSSTIIERQWSDTNNWVHRRDVVNFATARQANYPIIEFLSGLELNEYIQVKHIWNYRAETSDQFSIIDAEPNLLELIPFTEFVFNTTTEIFLDVSYGDVTSIFVAGYEFSSNLGHVYSTKSSKFFLDAGEYKTSVEFEITFINTNTTDTVVSEFVPLRTSVDDLWNGHNNHWVYSGIDSEIPSENKINNFLNIIDDNVPTITLDSKYDTRLGEYAQEFIIKDESNNILEFTSSNIKNKALLDTDSVRVYLNGTRQFGTFEEIPDVTNTFIIGIEMNVSQGAIVLVEVGTSALEDLGYATVPVRKVLSDVEFNMTQPLIRSNLSRFRRNEQVKSTINQYPIFNIFDNNGKSTNSVSEIFTFKTGQSQPIIPELGLRLDADLSNNNFKFEQHLLTDDDRLLSYKLINQNRLFWINTKTGEVNKLVDNLWTSEFVQNNVLTTAIFDSIEPVNTFNGLVWFDTINQQLKEYNESDSMFIVNNNVIISDENPSMFTIWRKSNDPYIPELKDWNARTLEEYNLERDDFISKSISSVQFSNPTFTSEEVEQRTLELWLESQINQFSETGAWVGDWTLPDYFYYNVENNNRTEITSIELTSHFNSIINSQTPISGFLGDAQTQFHVLTQDQIDYGVAGTIRQYNNNFSTFLSSVFVDNVVIPDLIEFAQNQYEILLDRIMNLAITNTTSAITDDIDNLDINSKLLRAVRVAYAEDSNLEFLYGDTTAYTGGSGIPNWIATLPILGLQNTVTPNLNIDKSLGLYEVTHHDGHRVNYKLDLIQFNTILNGIINNVDDLGKLIVSNGDPSKLFIDFEIEADAVNLENFFWQNSTTGNVFRLIVDFIQSNEPNALESLNKYWINSDDGELNISDGEKWNLVSDAGELFDGNTIETSNYSVWELLDIDAIVSNIVFEIEQELFSVSNANTLSFDTDSSLETSFLRYTRNRNIDLPFTNTQYSPIDAFSWNYYDSAPGSRFEMLSANPDTNSFVVDGEIEFLFTVGSKIALKNSDSNDGMWTIKSVMESNDVTTIEIVESINSSSTGTLYFSELPSVTNTGAESGAHWKTLYTEVYGTPYPHLEPWVLQGYASKPIWWDDEYLNDNISVYGTRRWKYTFDSNLGDDSGMWRNIRLGIVPEDLLLPNGDISDGSPNQVKSYKYFSVNVANRTISNNGLVSYAPDDLLPPFFDHSAAGIEDSTPLRSLFTDFNLDVRRPNAGYAFGQGSIFEYEWKTSSQFSYDKLAQIYLENPIEFLTDSIGFEYNSVDGLLIDQNTGNVPSNNTTVFHGTIDRNKLIKINGINQWYVNFNRYTGIDTNVSNFHQLWKEWTAPLSYQCNSFIDVGTFDVVNDIDIERSVDYEIFVKRTNGVESFSAHGLLATLTSVPVRTINFDNSSEWEIQVSNNTTQDISFDYHPVKNYPFYANVDSNILTLYRYEISSVDIAQQIIFIDGDISDFTSIGDVIDVNDMNTTITSVNYNTDFNQTQLSVSSSLDMIQMGDTITLDVKTLPWETGDSVWLSTQKTLPAPLLRDDGSVGPIEYYIIKLSSNEFQLSETRSSALAHLPIAVVNSGESIHFVGQIMNTFVVDGGNTSINWRHYELDERFVETFTMPSLVRGIQAFIDIVDGYVDSLVSSGFEFTPAQDTWQNQISRFVNYCFSTRNTLRNRTIDNRYQIFPNLANSNWSWDNAAGVPFSTGTPVNIVPTGGSLPTPFLPNIQYFVIANNDGTFNLANSLTRAQLGTPIPLMDNGSATQFDMHVAVDNTRRFPQIEVNSFKDVLLFNQPFGVVSDIISGPFQDIQITNTILDRHGNPLNIRDLVINRFDTQTEIKLASDVRSDLALIPDILDPIDMDNYHYISAATLFVDTYEHIIQFNDYTTAGNLIYDGFIGLNLNRMNLNFNRQTENNRRPNLGGSSIVSNVDKLETFDNLERSVTDLREAYGSATRNESNRFAPFAQQTLGYDINSTEDYLNDLGINERSQFQFWQGLIQTKGSTGSVDAFINSKQFLDARIDEFWAYEIGQFGSTEEMEYPELFVNPSDVVNNNIKLEFIESAIIGAPGYDNSLYDTNSYDSLTDADITTDQGFIPISINDNDRWYDQPDQFTTLSDNGLVLYFESEVNNNLVLNNSALAMENTPLVIHGFKTDQVIISVDLGYSGYDLYTNGVGFTANENTLSLRNKIFPFANHIIITKNGMILTEVRDYYISFNIADNSFFSNEVTFTLPLSSDDVIEVNYNEAILIEDLHYQVRNSNSLNFTTNEIFIEFPNAVVTVYGTQANFEAHNATRLIDNKSDSVLSDLNLFDPAREFFNPVVIKDVDVISGENPATVQNIIPNVLTIPTTDEFIGKNFWAAAEVGTVWVDTNKLAYIPYYDDHVFPDLNDRLGFWGRQADYSELVVWEWVESDVPPEEYDEMALVEQGDANLPEFTRKSGNARKIIYRVVPPATINDTEVLIPLETEIRTFSVLSDATPTGNSGEYSFILDQDFVDSPIFTSRVYNVYVNGILRLENQQLFQIQSTETVVIDNLREVDEVAFVYFHTIDEEEILLNVAIEEGLVRIGYEFSEKRSFDRNGSEKIAYYFWVQNKLTRARGNNQAPKQLESQWSTINVPYMVLQNPVPRSTTLSTVTEDFQISFNALATPDIQSNVGSSLQLDNQFLYNGAGLNGTFNGGQDFQIGDIITLSNNAVLEVNNIRPLGEISSFQLLFAGDLIQQNQPLTISDTSGTGTGFELTPGNINIGGVFLNVNSVIKLNQSNTPTDLKVTINGSVLNLDEHYNIDLNGRRINIFINLPNDANIGISYISERPVNSAILPARYTQAIIRNVREFINESNRYTVRFRKDFTRDDNVSAVNNKNLHREWKLFRQHQNFKIDRELWNKVTESMIGSLLSNRSVRVPSIAREIYDQQTNSETRIGLGEGQSFTDGQLAITTLGQDLINTDNDFIGIDISSFLILFNFGSRDAIIDAMDTIYNTFTAEDVNRMFFLILNDALTLKSEYAGLLKTSMISVYGVKVIETQGFFDE